MIGTDGATTGTVWPPTIALAPPLPDALSRRRRRAVSSAFICSRTKCSRAMSRRSSAAVFSGKAASSGGTQSLQALRGAAQSWFKAANTQTGQGSLHPVPDAGAFSNQLLPLTARTPGVLLFKSGNRRHAAMPAFAAQPAQKGTLTHRSVIKTTFLLYKTVVSAMAGV